MIRACLTIMSGAMMLAAPLESRADPAPEPAGNFCYGCEQLGLMVGGGIGVPVFGSDEREVDHTRILGVLPRWSIGLSDPVAPGAFYNGNFELGLEPLVLLNFNPRDGWAAGGCLLLHYNFLGAGDSLVPFVEGAAGASYMKFRLDGQADGFTYPLDFSIGVHALTAASTAFTASVGYYHLSNAGRHYPNLGINGIMLKLGFTAFANSF